MEVKYPPEVQALIDQTENLIKLRYEQLDQIHKELDNKYGAPSTAMELMSRQFSYRDDLLIAHYRETLRKIIEASPLVTFVVSSSDFLQMRTEIMNENCKSNQHEYEYIDDSFSGGFYSSSGGHYECCNCGHKASTKEVDG